MKREATEHPKLSDLVDVLERMEVRHPKAMAKGLLEGLWHFTARYAPPGNVGRFTDQAIARAVGWQDEPQALVAVLVDTGWLDRSDEHRLVVHDWSEHADDAVHRALARRVEHFCDGSRPRLTRLGPREKARLYAEFEKCAQHAHVGRTLGAPPEPRQSPAPPEPRQGGVGGVKQRRLWPAAVPDGRCAVRALPLRDLEIAFAAYGKQIRSWSDVRRKLLHAQLRELKPEQLVAAVHGYVYLHRRVTSAWDPLKHLTPETVFRASNVAKYVDAAEEARSAGRSPPFPLENVTQGRERMSERADRLARGEF